MYSPAPTCSVLGKAVYRCHQKSAYTAEKQVKQASIICLPNPSFRFESNNTLEQYKKKFPVVPREAQLKSSFKLAKEVTVTEARKLVILMSGESCKQENAGRNFPESWKSSIFAFDGTCSEWHMYIQLLVSSCTLQLVAPTVHSHTSESDITVQNTGGTM